MEVRRAWQGKLYEAGYLGMDWPAEWGGRGATEVEKSIFEAEIALRRRAADPEHPRHRPPRRRRSSTTAARSSAGASSRRCSRATRSGARASASRAPAATSRALKTSARPRRRPLRPERPEGLDDVRAVGRLDLRPRAHRLEGPLRRHLVHPLQARHAGRHGAAAPPDHRRERVRRGVLRGRARAEARTSSARSARAGGSR